MASKKGTGLLLIMVDVSADKDEEFNRWYNEEHLGVILALPGFLNAARYKAVLGGPKYLACYELESAAALETPEFAHQRANPTEWAQKIGTKAIGTNVVVNLYEQIFPIEVSQTVAQSDMAPVLQIGRMGVPAEDDERFNPVLQYCLCAQLREDAGLHKIQKVQRGFGRTQILDGLRTGARQGVPEPGVGSRQESFRRHAQRLLPSNEARLGFPRNL